MEHNFYRAFEEKHRGPRELIKSRLQVYLPFVTPLSRIYEAAEAIDLGCGRGEWLELLNESGFHAYGVDLDEGMLAACQERNLRVAIKDAVEALEELPEASQAAVTAFHVVEHIPFAKLQKLIQEALRVLLPGGLLILETPNPENLAVATKNFYLDPTHRRPIPPELLSFLPVHYGFNRVKIVRLQESPKLAYCETLTVMDVLEGVSPDYAVIAQRVADPFIMQTTAAPFAKDYGIDLKNIAGRYQQYLTARIGMAETTAQTAEQRAQRAETAVQNAEQRVQQAETAAQNAEQRAQRAETAVQNAEQRVQRAETAAQSAEQRAQRAETAVQNAEQRVQQAETAAQSAEQRAQRAETAVQNAEQRVQRAETAAQSAEQRAQRAETAVQNAEQRVQQAEIAVQNAEQRVQRAETAAQSAEQRVQQAETAVQNAEQRVQQAIAIHQAVLNSRSWRTTAPLRWMSTAIRWVGRGSRAWITLAPGSRPRRTARQAAMHLKLYVARRPRLKTLVLRCLEPFPQLKAHLRLLGNHPVRLQHRQNLVDQKPLSDNCQASPLNRQKDGDQKQLSPRACQIYNDLKKAIERWHKEPV
ncbi:Methyltransferase type 11 [Desulfobulbus propionicus DSM 2032]|uniref:Methyltransferase type 11 n=1 Tax=Desulfobulbus propionicus (strain ATCC 33891 / DSM 2032 / VKM B-1956 / 1pr3) TaxID=577650 RepID=A0A7U3YK37_DESPD|nr:class I SAM-dependent methyltransferase [Desulfobulbus propionicus]ADW16718.1 Methyltransferase type 11 [Desulfobulbus propionicus DSM 2032]